MEQVSLHLNELGRKDWFVLVVETVIENGKALIRYEHGDGGERACQTIPYTALPLDFIRLYERWDTEHWMIMLPSEY
jgi:hypothetical protein